MAKRENGDKAATSRKRRPQAPPDDLRAQVRARKKDQSRLSWAPVTKFVFKLMMRHPFMIAGVLLATLLLAAMEIANAALIAPFLNMLMGGNTGILRDSPIGFLIPVFEGLPIAHQLRWYALIFFGITFTKAGFLYGLTRLAQYLHIVINRDLRMLLFDDLLNVEMRWINKQKSSNLFTLVHSFPSSASKIVDQYMMGFQNFTSFVAIVVTLALVSVPLLLLSAVIGLVILLIAVQLTGLVRRLAYAVTESKLRLHSVTLEALSALKVLHLFGRTPHTKKEYTNELKQYQANQFKQASVKALVSPVQSILSAIFVAAILLGATFMYDLTSGAYLATIALFMTIVTKFQSRSGKYVKRRAEIAAEIPAMEEIIRHVERKDKHYIKDGREPFNGLREGVRFEDIHFTYDPGDPEVIKGVSFDLPKGKMVAIVGASGAGKSTLIDLLARLYDPDKGSILVDGRDLRTHRMKDWRARVAVVSQDSFLFNTSVLENIRFGRLDATDKEVRDAAKRANAQQFIDELPQGYATILGDRGVRLSGGQRQRIAIARAILADPDILILDEATSALDTQTEAQVQAALDEIARDRTIVAIAHRLSTVRRAHRILVLEEGRIVESGRHDQLLAKQGRYWEYVQLQDLGRRDDGGTVEQAVLPADERFAWVVVTLQKDASGFVSSVMEQEGVRAARARGRHLDVAMDAPSRTLPVLLRLFAKRHARVEAVDLDEASGMGGPPPFRWSGNGTGHVDGEEVWIDFVVEGEAGRLVDVFEEHSDVSGVSANGTRLSVLLRHPRKTVPELVRTAAAKNRPVLAIDPRDLDEEEFEIPLIFED